MRVLYVSNSWSFSPMHASAVTTYEIVKGLAERGHLVTVLVPTIENSKRPKEDLAGSAISNRVEVVSLGFPAHLRNDSLVSYGLLCSVMFSPLLLKALKRRRQYDLVISMFHPSHLATFFGYFIARVLKIPLFVKVHDLLVDAGDPSFLRRSYKNAMFRFYLSFLRKGDFFLVPSVEWVHMLVNVYKVRKRRIVLFRNGTDAAKFNPDVDCTSLRSALNLQNKKIVLYSGQISWIRGLDNLVHAMVDVVERDRDVRLLIVGEGSEKSMLVSMVKRLRLADHVLFKNGVSHNHMPAYICLANVTIGPLVSLPITVGTLPIKVIEYMACGKPVVACRNGTSEELMIDGYNGILISSNDTSGLSSGLIRLLDDEELAGNLGANARRHVEKHHDWNVITGELDRLLTRLVGND